MKILLIGNPNVGKSAIFSHLTGVSVTTSNYPGTTVQYTKGYLTYNGQKYEVIDVPGTYQLNPEAESEKVATDMIEEGDILVNVVDSTNLERNLNLTLQLMEYGKPMVLVLNMWDDARHKGIEIDAGKLEKFLKTPVISTNGLTGEGLNIPVSYTHLDVYKRQVLMSISLSCGGVWFSSLIKMGNKLQSEHFTGTKSAILPE